MTSTCIAQPDKCSVQHATGNMHSATCMEQPARCNMHTAHWMWLTLTAHRLVALLCLVRLWCWLCFCLLSFKCSFNMRNAVTRLHVTSLWFLQTCYYYYSCSAVRRWFDRITTYLVSKCSTIYVSNVIFEFATCANSTSFDCITSEINVHCHAQWRRQICIWFWID